MVDFIAQMSILVRVALAYRDKNTNHANKITLSFSFSILNTVYVEVEINDSHKLILRGQAVNV